jgi:hypothetical protein
MREELLECLEDQAEMAGRFGHDELAVRLAGAAHAYRSRLDLARSSKSAQRWEQRLAALRERVAQGTFDSAWGAGLQTEFSVALREARNAKSGRTTPSVQAH